MKCERNRSPQLEVTIKVQHQHAQRDDVDELYDFHTQIEVHDDDVLYVHALQG